MLDINKKIENALSKNCKDIMRLLEKNNFEAYAVGGCVRDALVGVPCHDEDITTIANPKQVIEVFKHNGYNVIETGIKHGTVTVFKKGSKEGFEITTYRSDGNYTDGRHPDNVIFETDIRKDLERRDLTINAMAYSLSKGFISAKTIDNDGIVHDGLSDLNDNIIRAVGDADKRFSEDALRIMRAIRFKAKMKAIEKEDWTICDDVKDAIKNLSGNLNLISKERIRDELLKIIDTGDISAIRDLQELKVLKVILPDLDKCYNFDQLNIWHDKDLFEHILSSVAYVDNLNEKIALLLHDIGKVDKKAFNTTLDFNKVIEFSNQFDDVNIAFNNFKENQTLNNFNVLLNTLNDKSFDLSDLRYRTVERNGEEFISYSFSGHAEESAKKAMKILKDLKFSNNDIKEIIPLIEHHDLLMNSFEANNKTIKKGLIDFFVENQSLANKEFFNALMRIKNADGLSQNQEFDGNKKDAIFKKNLSEIGNALLDGPHLMSDLDLNGNDLASIGLKGKEIQDAKKFLLRDIMFNPDLNSKDRLINLIKNNFEFESKKEVNLKLENFLNGKSNLKDYKEEQLNLNKENNKIELGDN